MRRGAIIGVALLLLGIGVLFRFSLMTFTLYAMIAAYVVSVALARSALDGVSCVRAVDQERAEIGDTLEVRALVRNGKLWPVLWVLVEEVLPRRLVATGEFIRLFTLRPNAVRPLQYRVTFTCRGYHQIGPVILESGDLFGFVRHVRTAREARYVTVRPRPEPVLVYDVATHRPIGDIKVRRRIYEDPTRLAGVRPYEVGDPFNRVHWKTTARTGVLHTRVYEATVVMGATVVLDFHLPAYGPGDPFERSELACVAAASICCYLVSLRESVGLLSNGLDAVERVRRETGIVHSVSRREARHKAEQRVGEDRLRAVHVPVGRGQGKEGEILDALARLELSEGQSLEQMLREEAQALSRELALIIITPALSRALIQAVAGLRFWGFIVTVMLIDNPDDYVRAGPVLEAEHVRVIHIRSRGDLRQIAGTGL
jgi:hypothetical protein